MVPWSTRTALLLKSTVKVHIFVISSIGNLSPGEDTIERGRNVRRSIVESETNESESECVRECAIAINY